MLGDANWTNAPIEEIFVEWFEGLFCRVRKVTQKGKTTSVQLLADVSGDGAAGAAERANSGIPRRRESILTASPCKHEYRLSQSQLLLLTIQVTFAFSRHTHWRTTLASHREELVARVVARDPARQTRRPRTRAWQSRSLPSQVNNTHRASSEHIRGHRSGKLSLNGPQSSAFNKTEGKM